MTRFLGKAVMQVEEPAQIGLDAWIAPKKLFGTNRLPLLFEKAILMVCLFEKSGFAGGHARLTVN